MYKVQAELEATARDGKQTRIVKTGELPHFFIEAPTPRDALTAARKIVNPCGDANAVHILCTLVGDEEAAVAA